MNEVTADGTDAATDELAPRANRWLITAAVSSGAFMGALDASITYVALPEIRGSLGATLAESTWANTSFIMATAIVLPLTGFIGRTFGQKRTYLLSLALFVISSLMCGACRSLVTLALCRALQGVAMGVLSPTAQAILQRLFPPHQRGMAMAIFTMMIVVGPAAGPLLGGAIVNHLRWPWIFAINAPFGVIGFAMVWRLLDEPEEGRAEGTLRRPPLDWQGLALLAMGMAAFQYVLEDGFAEGWFDSPRITALAIVACSCSAAFVARSLRAAVAGPAPGPAPVVELRLFRDPVYRVGTLLGAVAYLVVSVNLFLVPVFLQEVLGFTALQAGAAVVPRALVMIAAIPIVGALYNHVAAHTLVGLGLLSKAAGVYALTSIHLETGLSELILPLALQGIGASLIFVPLNTVIFVNVPRDRVADAAGLSLMMRHLGTSIGLALVATFLSIYTAQARDGIAASIVIERPEVQDRLALLSGALGRNADATDDLGIALDLTPEDPRLALIASAANKQATVLATRQLFAQAVWLLLLAVPFVVFLRGGGAPREGSGVPAGEL
jgi:MFS transporter, DHA2 family, multidrug resistance protein